MIILCKIYGYREIFFSVNTRQFEILNINKSFIFYHCFILRNLFVIFFEGVGKIEQEKILKKDRVLFKLKL